MIYRDFGYFQEGFFENIFFYSQNLGWFQIYWENKFLMFKLFSVWFFVIVV